MSAAPTVRPAQGFGTAKAQRWILASALIVGMTYMLRRFVEPTVTDAPARGGKAQRLAGHGSPPPSLAHWSTAYAAGFMFLALLALPAPELAASIAVLATTGTLLSNGLAIAADLGNLQGTTSAETIDQTNARVKRNLAAGRPPLYGMPGFGNLLEKPAGPLGPGGLG